MFPSVNFDVLTAYSGQDILTLVKCLVEQANAHGHPLQSHMGSTWDIQMLTSQPLQTSTISCGLWVLATIGAVLSGKHVTGMTEADMVPFRTILLQRVLTLPVN
jgi:hypothetical protein